ncbi:unnamed protein product [Diatraea saccharalis]|uniref:Protein artemis n=1 Tax=Diatraea saccharalis TaxID=40085 RepID=A0A9N9R6F3_9NEOP|nr:unnamed protein product [Diatraea saccharalis]
MCTSSFDGIISEVPGIAVDNFESFDKRAYFLSHCHRDHTQGLSDTRLKRHLDENKVYIYTSEVSAAIIATTADFAFVKDNVITLPLGTETIKLNETDYHKECYVQVTTIPAGHCFGSIMFLFRTTHKTVLFTGDFRISINDVSKLGQLHNKNGDPIFIDKMYVDTTFLNWKYDNFPRRSDSVQCALLEIKNWLNSSVDNLVALHTSAKYGYEFVFNEIFKQLGYRVYIGEGWNLYRLFQNQVPGVTNDAKSTRIHKCTNRNERYPHKCLPYDTSNKCFLYVHLSAMLWENFDLENFTHVRTSENRINICFPTHCSRSELVNFVSYFSPKQIIGFPNEYKVENVVKKSNIVFRPPKRSLRGDATIKVKKSR